MFFFLTCRNRSVLSSVGNPLFGVRQPCCRFSFSATTIGCKQRKPRLLESMTYEMQISQVLCFDIHTKCRGVGGLQSLVTSHDPQSLLLYRLQRCIHQERVVEFRHVTRPFARNR